ncbi:MAG: hypothetical protein PHD82_13355 [Candidatus Riflebacteria bacterium]|nr:hypothetical protein [Candidatus Riflebacteria bacterium]
MSEDKSATRFLIVMLLVTFLAGALVLVIKSDYRVRDNILSNLEYYPHIKLDKGTD